MNAYHYLNSSGKDNSSVLVEIGWELGLGIWDLFGHVGGFYYLLQPKSFTIDISNHPSFVVL